MAPGPPPVLADEASDPSLYDRFVPASVRGRPAPAASVADTLTSQYFCILDGFAGATSARAFRATCEAAWQEQKIFKPAKVATPIAGVSGERSVLTRSDHLAWVELDTIGPAELGAAEDWTALREVVSLIDSLVTGLASQMLGPSATATRHRPQLARYGKGDAFARHTDNHCPPSGVGPHCNGRWLTAIYYAGTEGWQHDVQGGCLRLYQPQGVEMEASTQQPQQQQQHIQSTVYDDDARLDVAPLEDRLIIFLSDFRVPHAVLPVLQDGQDRFAATCWYTVH